MSIDTRSTTLGSFAIGQTLMIVRGSRRAEVLNIDRETNTVVIHTSTGESVHDAAELYRAVMHCDYDGRPTNGGVFCSDYCERASNNLDRILDDSQ